MLLIYFVLIKKIKSELNPTKIETFCMFASNLSILYHAQLGWSRDAVRRWEGLKSIKRGLTFAPVSARETIDWARSIQGKAQMELRQ